MLRKGVVSRATPHQHLDGLSAAREYVPEQEHHSDVADPDPGRAPEQVIHKREREVKVGRRAPMVHVVVAGQGPEYTRPGEPLAARDVHLLVNGAPYTVVNDNKHNEQTAES